MYGEFPRFFGVNTEYWQAKFDANHVPLTPVNKTSTSEVVNTLWSRYGTSLPNWRAIIKSGGDATTDFDGSKQVFEYETGDAYLEGYEDLSKSEINRYDSKGFSGQKIGYGDLNPSLISSTLEVTANNRALKYLYGRIREDQTQFQGGIFLGELREALRMIKSPARTLRQEIVKYQATLKKRRPRINNLNTAKRVLSDTWLEFSFGWRPLLADISDGVTAYERLRDNSFVKRSFSATGIATGEEQLDYLDTAFGQVLTKTQRKVWSQVEVRYKCGSRRELSGQVSTAGIQNMLGLGWRDFVPTVWELVPWSFLVDYFVNVGEILDAGTTITGDLRWICKTVRTRRMATFSSAVDIERSKQVFGDLFITSGGTAGITEQEHSLVRRRRLATLPFPDIQVRIPGSPQKWINMAALAAGFRSMTPYYRPGRRR